MNDYCSALCLLLAAACDVIRPGRNVAASLLLLLLPQEPQLSCLVRQSGLSEQPRGKSGNIVRCLSARLSARQRAEKRPEVSVRDRTVGTPFQRRASWQMCSCILEPLLRGPAGRP